MNDLIRQQISNLILTLIENKEIQVSDDMPLVGSDSALNSMKLVELCLLLEDKSEDMGFEFDWTSDVAMSKSRSIFRTAGTLIDEFISQMESNK
jgi:acyl carrier protein